VGQPLCQMLNSNVCKRFDDKTKFNKCPFYIFVVIVKLTSYLCTYTGLVKSTCTPLRNLLLVQFVRSIEIHTRNEFVNAVFVLSTEFAGVF